MIPDLPDLQFIAIRNIIFHEFHDCQRTPPLIERIRQSGVFRNPPIVTQLEDGSGRYMVLDGANRITALHQMEYPHVLVQVVHADDPGVVLQNWNHVIWEMDPRELLAGIRSIPDLNLVAVPRREDAEPDLWGDCGLAMLQVPRGATYNGCTGLTELVRRVELLNEIVDSYQDRCKLDRTMARDIGEIVDIYPNLAGLVIFPRFKIRNVMELAGAGYLLPTGITRFTISPRALHVNYPLEELKADKSLEEKNVELKEWINKRIESKGVRYYAEATFLYDE